MEYNDLIRYFISNIQDIDDMLGPEPSPLSPGKRQQQAADQSDSLSGVTTDNNLSSISSESTVEEVPFTVVKVHDSAAQRAEVCVVDPSLSLSCLSGLVSEACANRRKPGTGNWPLATKLTSHLLSHPLIDPTIIMILQVQEYEEEIDSSAVLIRHNRRFTSIVRSSSVMHDSCADPLTYEEEDTLRAMDPDHVFYGVSRGKADHGSHITSFSPPDEPASIDRQRT